MTKKKIVFLTGTRADFGKLKSLIEITNKSDKFEVYIFATGMHLQKKYGYTVEEIEKCGYRNIYKFINSDHEEEQMDHTLARTILGFSNYLHELEPDLIVIHGDRVEPMAGAIAGALNNILVAHIEGGELSGTIDELIRHAITKLSHIHFVSNKDARDRLIQMGEVTSNIFLIGSPDMDVMVSSNLPVLSEACRRYQVDFDEYGIVLFHPVTTEIDQIGNYAKYFVDALLQTNYNYIVIFPNNDLGSSIIFREYERLKAEKRFRLFPSIRFEYFLSLLKNAQFIIGNSSCGLREAPYYAVPAVNIGTRQMNRVFHEGVINCDYGTKDILTAINIAINKTFEPSILFGEGNSDKLFLTTISNENFWMTNKQKQFQDLSIYKHVQA